MTIIMTKQGMLPAEREYTGTCTTCRSEYKALQGDLVYECDYRDSYYWASCQLCKSRVTYEQVRTANVR